MDLKKARKMDDKFIFGTYGRTQISIQRGRGVGFALRVLPVTLGAGTVVLLIAGGFFPALLLAAGLVLKVGENGLRYSLDQATRELLFLPVPDSLRTKAKAGCIQSIAISTQRAPPKSSESSRELRSRSCWTRLATWICWYPRPV